MTAGFGDQFLYFAIAGVTIFMAVLGYASIADAISARKRRR